MAVWISDADLADILGREDARTFTSVLGGQRIYVPRDAIPQHKIAMTIGLAGMERLCAARGGETLTLPNGRQKLTARRRAEKLLAEGRSFSYVADDCTISIRYVEQIATDLRARRMQPQQGSLFS